MDKNSVDLVCFLKGFCLLVYGAAATFGAFNGGMWASLGIGLAVVFFLTVGFFERRIPQPSKRLFVFTIGVLILFALELPFSSDIKISSHVWLQLLSIFIPLSILSSASLQKTAASPRFVSFCSCAAALGAFALGIELLSGGGLLHLLKKADASLTEYNRGMSHLAILAFPLIGGLWIRGKKYEASGLALLFLFPASLTESHTAKLALVSGGLCTFGAFYRRLWVGRGLLVIAILIMAWPFYAQVLFTNEHASIEQWHSSWRHRMEIWDYLSYRIEDRPLLGWGLGTTHTLDYSQPHGDWYEAVSVHGAPHAHNFITEIWVETGVIGLLSGLVFLLISLRSIRGLQPPLQPFALGCWLAALILATFGFDFWTDSLWAAFALSMFAFGVVNQRVESRDDIPDIKLV